MRSRGIVGGIRGAGLAAALSLLACAAAWSEPVEIASRNGELVARFDEGAQGIFSESFVFKVRGEELPVSGFRGSWGEGDGATDVEWSQSADGWRAIHRLAGGQAIEAHLRWLDEPAVLECRLKSETPMGSVQGPCLLGGVERLYSDIGWVVVRPQKAHDRWRLMTNFVVTDRDSGWSELTACDFGRGYTFDPETRRCAMAALPGCHELVFKMAVGRDGAVDLVKRYRSTLQVQPPSTIDKLRHRFLYDEWTGTPTNRAMAQLDQLRFAGCTDLLVLVHIWQKHGYDVAYPDIFPPNEGVGGVEGIRRLAEYCQARGIPFGLHDNYSDLYPDSPEFTLDDATSNVNGKGERVYARGWFNKHTGVQAYHFGGEAGLRWAKRNFGLMRDAFPLTAMYLDVTAYGDPYGYESPAGVRRSPAWALEKERALHDLARESFGGVPVIAEGCTEKFLGAVDAAGSDCWSEDRWNVDPGAQDWEYFPLFNLAFHSDVILYGVGYPGRYRLPDALYDCDVMSAPFMDDYRATRILMGNSGFGMVGELPQIGETAFYVREYYLSVPLQRQIERVPIRTVEWVDGDIHRIRVEYENGTQAWINRSDRPWNVKDRSLPRHGVWIEGPGFAQGTFASYQKRIDYVETEDLFFMDARRGANAQRGVIAEGMIAIEKSPDKLIVRPLADSGWIRIILGEFLPQFDPAGAKVRVVDFNGEVIEEYTADAPDGALVFQPQPKRLPFAEGVVYPGPPPVYYPYYIVEAAG